ncbi:mediator of RNA polymerase II transcription subunit 21 [Pyricularia oryzae Y34]|uniref:Mediator of RNA polymerase II transcription subunit 21 n=2 Tax=Pyricularia oryzae TaxID=318829 RepID=A0AA97NWN5_PYRO3|nr:mediator of RNA polymerase II transcription subunit 21 [Pyricularia oryzae Y34]
MGDRLTQLQDAVDQLAQQFVACLYYLHKRHDLETLGPDDKIRELKPEDDPKEVRRTKSAIFKSLRRNSELLRRNDKKHCGTNKRHRRGWIKS